VSYRDWRSGQIVGRSLTTRTSDICSECCETALCNKQLCQNDDPSCHDSGHVDCAGVAAFLDVCAEKGHAKQNCKRFCGLCSMVDGGWSAWSAWSHCTTTCGNGTVSRTRSCTNPAPADGGDDCTGVSNDVNTCSNAACPVNGGWSVWTSWGSCSVSCGIGLQHRDRTCSLPYPSNSGAPCFGEHRDDNICYSRACQDGGWTDWGGWTACSKTCDTGTRKRSRACTNPSPSVLGRFCTGDNIQVDNCAVTPCHDGGWTDWGGWTACSKTCETGTRKRSRSCTNPPPSVLGRFCTGDNSQVDTCAVTPCHEQGIGFTVNTPRETAKTGHITFTTVITNKGGGYNTTTGEFTCGVAGMYSFGLTIVKTSSASYAYCELYKNSQMLGIAYVHGDGHQIGVVSGSTTVYVHLLPGDKMYPRGCTAASTMVSSIYSTFTGHLVDSD